MVRTFFFLLSFLTDYETVMLIPHVAFTAGLVSASILGCVGVGRAVRKRLANSDAFNAAQTQKI